MAAFRSRLSAVGADRIEMDLEPLPCLPTALRPSLARLLRASEHLLPTETSVPFGGFRLASFDALANKGMQNGAWEPQGC